MFEEEGEEEELGIFFSFIKPAARPPFCRLEQGTLAHPTVTKPAPADL